MKFRHKPIAVKAIQWEPRRFLLQTAPGWLQEAEAADGRILFRDKEVYLYHALGKVVVRAGDWIICQEGDVLSSLPDAEFTRRYEKMEPEPA